MARKEMKNTSESGGRIFWLNETRVGQNERHSKNSDVELVQFFLKQFFLEHPKLFIDLQKQINSNARVFLIDGKVGPQTVGGIRIFQNFQKGGDKRQARDGVVSVSPPGQTGILHAGMLTILKLNLWIEQKTNIDVLNLEKHPDILLFAPNLLKEMLKP